MHPWACNIRVTGCLFFKCFGSCLLNYYNADCADNDILLHVMVLIVIQMLYWFHVAQLCNHVSVSELCVGVNMVKVVISEIDVKFLWVLRLIVRE